MARISLNRKIAIAFTAMSVMTLTSGILAMQITATQRNASKEISDRWLPIVSKSQEINQNLTNFRLTELKYVIETDAKARSVLKEKMEEYNGNLSIYRKVFEPFIQTSAQQKIYLQFSETWDKYSDVHNKLIASVEENKSAEGLALVHSTNNLYQDMDQAMTALSNESFDAGTKASEAAGHIFQIGKYVSAALCLLSVFLVLGVWYLIRRDVITRLGPIAHLTKNSSGSINESVTTLSESTSQLSNSSASTAAALEETVASIEELAATVSLNTVSAKSAAALARTSQAAVEIGQKNIQRMKENMNDVHASSKKIRDILELIDDISFQTNLLALNAAVEAARAGEQGRGFAVVADAVRTLAKKSADSAKEISDLINSSAKKTELGVQLATESEKSLAEIVDSVGKVSSLIEKISTAAEEQDIGISQVSKALSQIDQAIQGNSLSTHNIASSAESLKAQALSLGLLTTDLNEFTGVQQSSEKIHLRKVA